jgi:Ca2+-binding EF-hand superfamily protein
MKTELKNRGAPGFVGLQRKFRIMDDDGTKSLNMSEFKKAMKEMKFDLSDPELRRVFDYFDTNRGGSIDFEEFIQGVRDPLNDRRRQLVSAAFSKLDRDGSGFVDAQEVASMYDTTKHPDVLSGKKSPDQVFREFLDTFDVGGEKDGKVTLPEFENYYTNIGANIDNDDYFELMIRNAWHISGGEGWSANSANRRVLVTHADGRQSVEEIKNDLGLKAGDKAGAMARLRAQGTNASQISFFDGGEINDKGEKVAGTSVQQEHIRRKGAAPNAQAFRSSIVFGDDSTPASTSSTSRRTAVRLR